MEKVLHYVYDPLCGWCYAAEALIEAATGRAAGRFEVRLHAGGLFSRTRLSEAKRSQIRVADARIGEMTGQVFGVAYLKGLLRDPNALYDSIPPIRGILAAEAVQPGSGLPMLKGLQRAHYQDGRRIVESTTIAEVAESVGLDKARFIAAFEAMSQDELAQHLGSTHVLMQKVGAQGYPTFVAQTGGHIELLPHERFYGNAKGFAELVSRVF